VELLNDKQKIEELTDNTQFDSIDQYDSGCSERNPFMSLHVWN